MPTYPSWGTREDLLGQEPNTFVPEVIMKGRIWPCRMTPFLTNASLGDLSLKTQRWEGLNSNIKSKCKQGENEESGTGREKQARNQAWAPGGLLHITSEYSVSSSIMPQPQPQVAGGTFGLSDELEADVRCAGPSDSQTPY